MTDTVSVIIPVYNVEKYLHQCIDSVLCQTYKALDILLIDDGSTDSSGNICDEYAALDGRIRVIHKQNGGLSSARNAGIDSATGQYIYFLDSDDWLDTDAAERLCGGIKSESADVVLFDALTFSDGYKGSFDVGAYVRKHKYETCSGDIMFDKLLDSGEFRSSACLMFFKREFLLNCRLRFRDGLLYEDMLFSYNVLMSARRVACMRFAPYHRRLRPRSIMTSSVSMHGFESIAAIYDEIRSSTAEERNAKKPCAVKYMRKIAFCVVNRYNALSVGDKKTAKKEYFRIKADILHENGFGDRSLYLKSKNRALWVMYKCTCKVGKVFGRRYE